MTDDILERANIQIRKGMNPTYLCMMCRDNNKTTTITDSHGPCWMCRRDYNKGAWLDDK